MASRLGHVQEHKGYIFNGNPSVHNGRAQSDADAEVDDTLVFKTHVGAHSRQCVIEKSMVLPMPGPTNSQFSIQGLLVVHCNTVL